MKKLLVFVMLVTINLLLCNSTFARKFYFSTTGNDTYSVAQAQNPATPWKTLVRLQTFGNSGQALAGDTFAFKRGDVFINGRDEWGSFKWWNVAGYTCPSGTANKPIVFTHYGDTSLQRPNFLFPYPSTTRSQDKYVLTFEGVGYITIDGLQFNDTRFPVNDKKSSAYTTAGLVLGELPTAQRTHHMVVKNCNFTNIGYGIISAGNNIAITDNRFTNFKSVGDTIGMNDIGADPLVPTGSKYLIKNNYFSGSWAYANPNSSSDGLLGGAIESIDDFDSSLIIYNTFLDCSGGMEFGQISGSQYGPNDDTFAYNLFVNVRVVSYVNTGSSSFACQAARLRFWNNVVIENNNSRFSGANFGRDVLGDGQSFMNFNFWPNYPLNQSTNTGSRVFQYTEDTGLTADTLYDLRNNIIWNTTRQQVIYDNTRTKFKHSNNIYKLSGGSTLGGTLNTGTFLELSTTAKIFTDTANLRPELWDLHLYATSPAINFGRHAGIINDFSGNQVVGVPDAGIFEFLPPSSSFTAASTAGTILCNGGTTTVTISGSGGVAPYTGVGTFTVTAGIYTYNITDAAGTTKSTTITVTQPNAVIPSTSFANISTIGGSTTVNASAIGGTGTYSYSFNNGAFQTSASFTGVVAGTYTMRAKDANGCIGTTTFTVSPPVIPLSASATIAGNILCNGGSTSINVNATGGTAPYTGTGTFTVTAGTYNYTIRDVNGLIATTSITVSQPNPITATVSAGSISIYGGTTSITISGVANGTTPYTYALNTGSYQTTNIFNNVAAGAHNVLIKDARGCILTKPITINQPLSTLACAASATSIACNGGTSTITVTATGGTSPYVGTGVFSVPAGTYSYTVTDAVGSIKTTSVTINQPNALTINATSGTIQTYGGTTTVTAAATGGTGTLTYKLNNGTYQSSNIFTGVVAGTHVITVKDANNCNASVSNTINQPTPPLIATSSIAAAIICNGGTTTSNVTATGGIAPYTGTGAFTVGAGSYTYTITDAAGTRATCSLTVSQPLAITANVTAGTIAVYGSTTTITVSAVNNGTAPYTYALNNGTFQTTATFNNVAAGSHNITIKDSKGCTLVKPISISQPLSTLNCTATAGNAILCNSGTTTVIVAATGGTPPYIGTGTFTVLGGNYSYTVTDAVGSVKTATINVNQPTAITPTISFPRITILGRTTTVTITANGGTGAYSYKLSSAATYQTSNVFNSVAAGTYTLFIKDANGCVVTKPFTITQPAALLSATSTATASIICNGGTTNVNVTATGGTAPYTGTGNFTVAAGTYTYTVADSNGVTTTTSITVSQPAILNATLTPGAIAAFGGRTTLTVSNTTGGTAPYSYALNGGTFQTSTAFSNVAAGTNTITIKDSKGCTIVKSITITQPITTLNCASTATAIACNGGTSTVTVTATGGTPPYIGTGTFVVSTGNYTYTVTDAVGSIKTTSINIGQPLVINPTITTGNIIVNGGTTTINASATGGVAPYSYKLNNGAYQTSGSFNAIYAGVDTIFVKDANNCVVSRIITINQPAPLVIAVTNSPIICFGGTSTVTVSASGGTAPYTGIGTLNYTQGTYTFTITDANGITATRSNFIITQPTALSATTTVSNISNAVYPATGTITVSNIAGGNAPYTISLDGTNYQTATVLNNVTAGNRTVYIKDNLGCVLQKLVTITQPFQIIIVSSLNSCTGQTNGSITVSAIGGTRPYVYRITSSPNNTTTSYSTDSVFTMLGAGVYGLRAKDNNGNGTTSNILDTILSVSCAKDLIAIKNIEIIPDANTNDNAYSIFPNPSNEDFTLTIPFEEKNNTTITVYDATGRKILTRQSKNRFMQFGKSFIKGVYWVRIDDGKNVVTKKIMKY